MNVQKILKSVENYDEIVSWQQKLANSQNEDEFYSVSAGLMSVYGQLAKQGIFSGATKQDRKIAEWLAEQLSDFWDIIMVGIKTYPVVATSVALKIILIYGKYRKQEIGDLVDQLALKAADSSEAIEIIQPELIKYDDLRYALISHIPNHNNKEDEQAVRKLVPVLCTFEKEVRNDSDLTSIYATKLGLPFDERKAALRYRQAWQQAWLHILRLPLNREEIKEILTVMHARIIPNLTKPQLMMDFLVDAYEHGGAISLLALNALFILIQYHQLDYPQFFTKLYELLEDGSLLASAHRSRFLRLLDLFLTSTHLPATIPASIVKRLARLCLFSPPGAIVAIIPFVYNQLKRHPTCMVMIHRQGSAQNDGGSDPYDNNEPDPLLTKALDSSLWELQSLTSHYHPNVAAIARIFSQPFRKPQYQLEHFLSHSYETLYATEYHRKRDRQPGLEFEAYNVFDDLSDTWSY